MSSCNVLMSTYEISSPASLFNPINYLVEQGSPYSIFAWRFCPYADEDWVALLTHLCGVVNVERRVTDGAKRGSASSADTALVCSCRP
jgi:hypothetical protein